MKDKASSSFRPILTCILARGRARLLVPSRLHTGTFYALAASAAAVFKQLIMVGRVSPLFTGSSPCFRDLRMRPSNFILASSISSTGKEFRHPEDRIRCGRAG